MNRTIAVIDLETDPFSPGSMVWPFVAGYYDGCRFVSYWGSDCVERMVTFLLSLPEPQIIYAHNGGRFDYFYFLKYLGSRIRIVNSRIIQAYLDKHELRDSFAIMPFALEKYHKTEIDYAKFSGRRRESHRDEIISYLRDDCVDLHTLCVAFREEFGDALTIGSASMKELKKYHQFETGTKDYDTALREKFYFGGRNQCFQSGIINAPPGGDIQIYDVNSMYPYVMSSYLHPVSTSLYYGTSITRRTVFVTVFGRNMGAFPTRQKDGSLTFTEETGTFHTTIHEYKAALETSTFKPTRILQTINYSERISFHDFIDSMYQKRLRAMADNDKIRTLFYKFVMNSSYGKFAQNPLNFREFFITHTDEIPATWHDCKPDCEPECRYKWTPSFRCDDYIIWSKPSEDRFYFNVATGASITGAARAELLRGIAHAHKPLYCDTDSVMCFGLRSGLRVHESELGSWKLEATGKSVAICGKKLYAVFSGKNGAGECVKKAHKGAKLTGAQILKVAMGETVESVNPVPTFKFNGSWSFTNRNIRITA